MSEEKKHIGEKKDEPVSEPFAIPEESSPLRFMMAKADGESYQAFKSLAEARTHPQAAMIMEADSGGQILVTCPVSKVRADEDVLHQLLCDLETITWGQGDSPRQVSPRMLASTMNHCRLAPESVAAWEAVVCLTRHGFMTSSNSCACAPQIEEILAGKRKRLQPQEGVRFTGR